MAKKLKDTDYLFISTYLRAREKNLLTAARMERMIDAPSAEEAAKVLHEKEIDIIIDLNDGSFSATAWGCDLTYDYVKINGDYRT